MQSQREYNACYFMIWFLLLFREVFLKFVVAMGEFEQPITLVCFATRNMSESVGKFELSSSL